MSLRVERTESTARLVLSRPPHNYFDLADLTALADALAEVDRAPALRASVLCSDQKSFCAGADFGGDDRPDPGLIYAQAVRLMERRKPLVAAVRGAAVGGGLGLALTADFRVGSAKARFQANFVRIGLSPGFGISLTLPRLIGAQPARDLLLTARRVDGEEAYRLGLLDRLVEDADVEAAAQTLALQLSEAAPAAMVATRRLLDGEQGDAFKAAVRRELEAQAPLFMSTDFAEGVAAARERRTPSFQPWENPA